MNADLAQALLRYRKATLNKLTLFSAYQLAQKPDMRAKIESDWAEAVVEQKQAALDVAVANLLMYQSMSDADLQYIIDNNINISFSGVVTHERNGS